MSAVNGLPHNATLCPHFRHSPTDTPVFFGLPTFFLAIGIEIVDVAIGFLLLSVQTPSERPNMPDETRLKIKVGEHEFEAAGSPDDVREQYKMFMELVATMGRSPAPLPQIPSNQDTPASELPATTNSASSNDAALPKIMNLEGRVVSMTIRPKSLSDGVMLLMLGHKVLRNSEWTTGAELLDGLKTTGGLAFDRIDRLMEKLNSDGDIIITGERRAKKYRMTNAGMTRARQLAQDLLDVVA